MTSPAFCVAAIYRFTPFPDPPAIRASLAQRCAELGLTGTLLVAPEGLNGTVAGSPGAIEAMLAHLRALPGCAGLEPRLSHADAPPFGRMKVRLKREIVTMGQPGIDPRSEVGHYVEPADWNALIDDPDTIVIDTRNTYEVALGTFAGALDPGTRTFREFPDWFRRFRAERGGSLPRVAMFCTGGIRCEKATAFLKAEGIENVHHLKGGILAYLDTIPPQDSRWSGECFVFDERVTVTERLAPGTGRLCPRCQSPVDAAPCAACAG